MSHWHLAQGSFLVSIVVICSGFGSQTDVDFNPALCMTSGKLSNLSELYSSVKCGCCLHVVVVLCGEMTLRKWSGQCLANNKCSLNANCH
jgi:hypothetical protein